MAKLIAECLSVTFVCILFLHSGRTYVCPYTECSCDANEIWCMDLGLPAIPSLTNAASTGFTSLLLDSNYIQTVPAGSLPSGLTSISFTNNPISSVDDTAFIGSSTNLTSLSFGQARFSRIPDAFLPLKTLLYLDIYDTQISDWNENALKIIGPNLLTLDLENVGLKSWPDWLKYFPKLEQLTLGTTTISSVPNNALDSLALTLTDLSMTNSNLVSVPMAMSKLMALQSLHLEANTISNLTWLPQKGKLITLSLSNNNILDANHLSASLRPYAESLKSLEIEYNQLPSIPDLSYLAGIESLDISHNRISDSNSGKLPSGIYEFDLSYNFLSYVPTLSASLKQTFSLNVPHNIIKAVRGSDFHPMITEADLSYNQIVELTNTSFPLNFGIVEMDFSSNPLARISIQAFDNLHSLTTLKLTNTKLARLPLAINSLVNMYSLDMTESSQLVCTCAEKSLRSKIISIPQIKGQCGETDIFTFFNSLSLGCSV